MWAQKASSAALSRRFQMQPLGRPAGKVVCVLFLCATMAYGREDIRGHMLVCCLTLGGQHVFNNSCWPWNSNVYPVCYRSTAGP